MRHTSISATEILCSVRFHHGFWRGVVESAGVKYAHSRYLTARAYRTMREAESAAVRLASFTRHPCSWAAIVEPPPMTHRRARAGRFGGGA